MTIKVAKQNPFDFLNVATESELFAGRESELTVIEDELRRMAGPQSIAPRIAIVGTRRVGKTSLLHRVVELCDKNRILPVRVNITSILADDAWEFWANTIHCMLSAAVERGIVSSTDEDRFGFDRVIPGRTDPDPKKALDLPFVVEYRNRSGLTAATVPPNFLVEDAIRRLCDRFVAEHLNGLLLILDEAHKLLQSDGVKEQLRHTFQEVERCGIVFAGESDLNTMFSDESEPFYAQALTIPLQNFTDPREVAQCALLPLEEDERALMSPMTMDYLSRLSRGKPNQIRLICNSIYKNYQKGHQDDLNITIKTMDDVMENIESSYGSETSRGDQVDAIRRLGSVDLEALYNMTRYPDWSTQDVIDFDESFRGEARQPETDSRRARVLEEKKNQFIAMGLMNDDVNRCRLAGDEFLYLYLRFWYEVQKYGDMSRRLQLGKGPSTLFGEKTEKLVHSLSWEVKQTPEIVNMIDRRDAPGVVDASAAVKRRFVVLAELMAGRQPRPHADLDVVNECFAICELVRKPGRYFMVLLSVRSQDNPRLSIQVEAYFHSEVPLVVSLSTLRKQAEDASVWIEDSDTSLVELPDLDGFLGAIGGATLDDLMQGSEMVARWRLSSIQHLVKAKSSEEKGEDSGDQDEDVLSRDWLDLYQDGDLQGADDRLTQSIKEMPPRQRVALHYNDRGYIRYDLNSIENSRLDLQRALDLHFSHLQLTLLNLAVIAIDQRDYENAIHQIEDALFLALQRQDIVAGHLRLRIIGTHLRFCNKERWEQHPANVIEAGYVNLAYAVTKSRSAKEAIAVLKEGAALIPSSWRMKHALGRLYLLTNNARLADPLYAELSELVVPDRLLSLEVRSYSRSVLRKKPRRR